MSFNDTLDDLETLLKGDTALLSYCNTRFSKTHTVKRVFKRRTELSVDELPLMLLTRPNVQPGKWKTGGRDYNHTALLYCGFYCEDKEDAQEILVEFEEFVDAAILAYKSSRALPAGIEDIDPQEAANDEGLYHPVYFFVKKIEINERRIL